MTRLTLLLSGTLVLLMALSPSFAYHTCGRCAGRLLSPADTENAGGDGKPLLWRSAQRLEHPSSGTTPQIRCYERGIKNASEQNVTDVFWEVAFYMKALILAHGDKCDALSVQGETKLKSGDIVFGPSRTPRYSTSVWMPDKGWFAKGADRTYGEIPSFVPELAGKWLVLTSGVSFTIRTGDAYADGNLSLESGVLYVSPATYRYEYALSHDSPRPITVVWGTVRDDEGIRDSSHDYILSEKHMIFVPPGKRVVFTGERVAPPKWGIGRVVVSDPDGHILSEGVASSYGPVNGFIRDPH